MIRLHRCGHGGSAVHERAEVRVGAAGWAQRSGSAQRCGRATGFASLRRSAPSADSPALLDPRSHRGTRCVRCAHFAQTAAMSQITKRVLRTRRPRVCAARRRRGAAPAAHPHLCGNRSGLWTGCAAGSSQSRGRVAGRAPVCGAEERTDSGLERYAATTSTCLRPCTRGRVVEVAPSPEHRRAVDAQRRLPQRSTAGRPPTALRRSTSS